MSIARSFDNIGLSGTVSADPFIISYQLFTKILNESSTLKSELIGSRFQPLAQKALFFPREKKTSLELMEEIGLLGAIEDNEVSSENYKEFIKKSLKNRHGENR